MPRLILSFLLLATAAFAGPGHDHGDEPGALAAAAGPIRLTETMARNLDLQTTEAVLQPLEKSFPVLGHVEADQMRVAAVSPRIAGRVTQLAVQDGDAVRAGDFLLELESRVVADPPPRLRFVAPRDGVVFDLSALAGEAVAPETPLLRIADLAEVFAVAPVHEGQLAAVRPSQRVRARALAFPDAEFAGTVERTAAGLDRETGTLRVFVRVANPDGRLRPGMRLRLAFVTADTDAAVVVPRAAVLGEGGDLFVFRQTAPLTYERTPVVTGLRDERFIEIVDGVLPGDLVVTRGNYQLQYVGGAAAKPEEDHAHGPGGHQH